jgi:PTH2 family peptidyl-tRNA hydrolase
MSKQSPQHHQSLDASDSPLIDVATVPSMVTPSFPAPLLEPLLSMGFSLGRAQRGLHYTGVCSVESAMNWVFEHADDVGIDEPFTLPAPVAAPAVAVAASPAAASIAVASADGPVRYDSFPFNTPFKLVFVVRTDLHMRSGKIAAQVAHAAVGTLMDLQESAQLAASSTASSNSLGASASLSSIHRLNSVRALNSWLSQGQAKVVVQIGSADEMHALERRAHSRGIATHIVMDAGRTQIAAGSETVCAVGPGPVELINEITGHLKLL